MDKVIVVASKNAGKIKEFKEMLEPKGYEVKSLADYPDIGEIDETGTTFSANAIIKAQAITDKYHIMAISDDSGLEIDAFDKQPGVQSARWLGHDTPYSYKNQVVLDRMKDEIIAVVVMYVLLRLQDQITSRLYLKIQLNVLLPKSLLEQMVLVMTL